jgi:radical SAM superfamily enzyme YgiQ (UPF0313 family)
MFVKPLENIKPLTILQPMGAMFLAAYLREQMPDVEPRIVDMIVDEMSYDDFAARFKAFTPDVLCVSGVTLASKGVHRTAEIAKQIRPETLVVAGGAHASAYPEKVMADDNVDYAVLGEGELTLVDLLKAHRDGASVEAIDGLAHRVNGELKSQPRHRYVEDLDSLPFPAWDLIPVYRYKNHPRFSRTGVGDYMTLFTSRACPFRCIYCHNLFGKKFRMRSPENVVEEIRILYDQYGIREFEIVDDCFNCHLNRARRILELIIESGMKIRMTFPNGLRGDRMDEDFVVKMRKAGTVFVGFAVETASPRLQRIIKKNLDLEKVKKNISLARRERIIAQGFFMLGFPTETREELQATVDYAVNSDLHAAHLFVVNPFEGTDLAEWAKSLNKPVHEDFERSYFTEEVTNLTEVSDEEFDRIRRVGLRRFWLRPSRMWAILRDYPYKRNFPKLLVTLIKRLLIRG